MTTEFVVPANPLPYLPPGQSRRFAKRQFIYNGNRPNGSFFLLTEGRVKILTLASDRAEIVARIIHEGAWFGESALIGSDSESALAMDAVTLLEWKVNEIELQIAREPRLAMALLQHLICRSNSLQERIEVMARYTTQERVMRSLIQLASTLGKVMPDGSTRFAGLTHQTIAAYVGTSREIISTQMNRLRHLGLVQYSRKHIDVSVPGIREALAAGQPQKRSTNRKGRRTRVFAAGSA
jgi:CRP/FNR family transcriptional regulator